MFIQKILFRQADRFNIFKLTLNLTGANTHKLVKLLVCLIKSLLCHYKHIIELVELGLYTAEYFPNLCTSLLHGKSFESHLQRIEQSRHCTRTCNIHLVLTLKNFNKSHIDNLAVKPLKRKKHNRKFRCVRRINVLIVNILCLALYTLNKCFLCRFNALLVTAFNRITKSRICIARKFGINRQIYCTGTVSRQFDCKLNNIF